jgi:putative colanic acid biosynthesis acetyltransferase WcaF
MGGSTSSTGLTTLGYQTTLIMWDIDRMTNMRPSRAAHICRYQDLSKFRMPSNFRGRPGWYVQLWWLTEWMLFHPSPQFCYAWRAFLLRCFGATVGKDVIIRPSVTVTYPWKFSVGDYSWIGDDVVIYSLADISIGSNSVVSQKSYLCGGSHDMSDRAFRITSEPIVIEDECWIASDVFICPGVTIAFGSVVGARSTVTKNVPAEKIMMGTPARIVGQRSAK